jgi:D-alanyl-D-alanine carboxypeptidase
MEPPRITLPTDRLPRQFPVLTQLGILAGLLGVIFGVLLMRPAAGVPAQEAIPLAPLARGDRSTLVEPLPMIAEDVPIVATAAYVWDVAGQRALYTKNHTETLPLASITKLMTTLIAHELVSDNVPATVSLRAVQEFGNSGLTAGERFAMKDLLALALVTSSNDAAYALGEQVGRELGDDDPNAQFVAAMNIRAEELGLSTLRFFNTTGLDESPTQAGGYGSARDVTFLMEYLVRQYPELLEPTTEEFMRIYNEDMAYHNALNTNQAVRDIPNLIGSKTGFTDLAGGNLTIAVDTGFNRPVIITVLGSTRDARFSDALALLDAITP